MLWDLLLSQQNSIHFCSRRSVKKKIAGKHDRTCLDGGHAVVALCIKEHVSTPSLSSSCEYRTRQFYMQPKIQRMLCWPQRMFMLFWRHIRSTPSPCWWLIGVLVTLDVSCGLKRVDFTCAGRIGLCWSHTHGADNVLCCRLWTRFRRKGCVCCLIWLFCAKRNTFL